MRVLVTGATGFIGKHLVAQLRKDDTEVRCLVRQSSATEDKKFLKNLGAEIVYGDITKENSFADQLEGISTVYHLAGVLGSFGIPWHEYHNTHVNGTRNLLSQCAKQKFIYCSSAGVHGPIDVGRERSPYNPTNAYEQSKMQAEQLVKKHRDFIIIRPEFVYGPFDMHALPLFRALRDGRFYLIGGGECYLHPTFVGDVVQMLLRCANSHNQSFIIAGERALTVKEFSRLVASLLGVRFKEKSLPVGMARGAAWISELVGSMLGFEPTLTLSRIDFFTQSRRFSTQKARRMLRYKPMPLEKGLKLTVEWYRKNGLL